MGNILEMHRYAEWAEKLFGDLFTLMGILYFVFLVLATITYSYKLKLFFTALCKKEPLKFPKSDKKAKFLVLLPARDESKVIRGLLESLERQTYSKENINIMIGVESLDDPTCQIAKEYGYEIYLKKNLEKVGKGFIIQEMIEHASSNGSDYELCIIFDADNIVSANYLELMNDAYQAGNEVGVGYRNTKNWNSNAIAACSGLTFTRFSRLENLGRSRNGSTVQLSGTGFYISRKKIEEFGGWKFHTLTEDLELTLQLAVDGTKTTYVHDAVFYDEQPTTIKASFNQRKRWVNGYMQANKIYLKKMLKGAFSKDSKSNRLGCFDFAFQAMPFGFFAGACIIITLLYLSISISGFVGGYFFVGLQPLMVILAMFFTMYIGMVLDTMLQLYIEKDRVKLNRKNYIKTILFNPIFISAYLIISISAMFDKKKTWDVIEHDHNLDNRELDKMISEPNDEDQT